jgi:hypothetical protein
VVSTRPASRSSLQRRFSGTKHLLAIGLKDLPLPRRTTLHWIAGIICSRTPAPAGRKFGDGEKATCPRSEACSAYGHVWFGRFTTIGVEVH